MVRGSAWLSVDDTDEPGIALSSGDLAVLPLGHTHALRDAPRSAAVRLDDIAQCNSRSVITKLEVGGQGPETSFVTGAFVLDDPLARQILAVLPPVIRMTPETEQGVPSFFENIQFITREVETDRPGSEVVLLRMADVIFIQILRAYLARAPDDGGGFLGALRDPSTAAALGAMHHRAEAPWTVASGRSKTDHPIGESGMYNQIMYERLVVPRRSRNGSTRTKAGAGCSPASVS
jgi:hypothetical protein